jgi:hypothetical protein
MKERLRILGLGVSLIGLGVAVAGCETIVHMSSGGPEVQGTGAAVSETRKVAYFSRIAVGGGIDLDVKFGDTQSVSVEAQSNLAPLVLTSIDGETLKIEEKESFNSDKPIVVHVVTGMLDGLVVSGGSIANVDGLQGDSLASLVSGGAKLKLHGSVKDLQLDASGGSEASIDGLHAVSLRASSTGGSTVLASGKVDTLSLMASGAGQFNSERLAVKDATIEASGASRVSVDVSRSLNANANGASTIRYSGNPKTVATSNGASTIEHSP